MDKRHRRNIPRSAKKSVNRVDSKMFWVVDADAEVTKDFDSVI